MSRKTKQDWFEETRRVLEESGAVALTIDLLTERLGVTKGSFYHHFGSYQGFKEQFLAYAEEHGTLHIIQLAEAAEQPLRKLERLFGIVGIDFAVEVALRAWALQDPDVRAYQIRVDERRRGYMEGLFLEMGFAAGQAEVMAQIAYSMYVGCQQIIPPIEGRPLAHLFDEFKRLYGLGG